MAAQRLRHLDGVRGIAAFLVFVCHFVQVFLPHVYYANPSEGHGLWEDEFATSPFNIVVNGNFAVCLFFVLSGYVLSCRFLASGDLDGLRRLAAKRYLRLAVPALAAVMVAWTLLELNGYSFGAARAITLSGMTDAYAHGMPWWAALRQGAVGAFFAGDWSLDPVLWTMQTELYGSFLVLGLLALFGQRRSRWLAYAVASAIFYNSYYLAFLLGVVLADSEAWCARRVWPFPLLLGIITLGVYGGSYPYYGAEHALWALLPDVGSARKVVFYHILGASALIFASTHLAEIREVLLLPICSFLGRISYSLYLIHFPLVCSWSTWVMLQFYPQYGYSGAVSLAFVASVPVVVVAAYLFTIAADEPAIRLADYFADWLTGRKKRAAETAEPVTRTEP